MGLASGRTRRLPGRGWWWLAGLCLWGGVARAQASGAAAWRAAAAARSSFEEEPVGEHTRAEYAAVMDNFRAIYHGDPRSVYAPRAVGAVAELLAEEGTELHDRKAMRDAAGQWEFLAKGYPGSSLAAPGLVKAVALLGPGEGDDAVGAARVRGVLARAYGRSAAARGVGDVGVVGGGGRLASVDPTHDEKAVMNGAPGGGGGVGDSRFPVPFGSAQGGMTARKATATANAGGMTGGLEAVDGQRRLPGVAPALVTGIRHWSTATYTRVAVDLGGEVEYQAARVEGPDRVFFDLHGAKLAAGLAGKSFAVTDDGFLKMIRVGQAGPDVARIVLEVAPVAEYSAFLLPNPTRLIIDVHGKAAGQREGELASQRVGGEAGAVAEPTRDGIAVTGSEAPGGLAGERAEAVAPVERVDGGRLRSVGSSLPPMPVTDGSAGFGLGPRGAAGAAVARPRVVVAAQPTAARPVPNAVASAGGSREVAAVSEGPGVVAATARPTTGPVVAKIGSRKQGTGNREQGLGIREQGGGNREEGLGTGRVKGDVGAVVAGEPAVGAGATAAGQGTLMRALGLKIGRIVIDAGHGGHDSGTLGPGGIEEKDVVLDVALRLGKLLHDRLGAEVVYTRADDTFVPLETRTAIANKAQADLFVSVHANSSADAGARGVEVYYLNFTSDPEAMQVASRENAVSQGRVNQLSDLVKKIALKDKIDESRELAADVDQSLYAGLRRGNAGLKDRGVKKAPFVVLIGANMPSILAEISFVTNPEDARELEEPGYRERVAESLYAGVARYAAAINSGGGGGKKAAGMERALR